MERIKPVLLIFLVSFTFKRVDSYCPDGWKDLLASELAGRCILIEEKTGDFSWAQSQCMSQGGELVSVETLAIVVFLTTELVKHSEHSFWVGLTEVEGRLRWNNGVYADNQTWVESSDDPDSCFTFTSDARVHPTDCNSIGHGYICSRVIPKWVCGHEKSRFSYYNETENKCTFMVEISKTKSQALDRCFSSGGSMVDWQEIPMRILRKLDDFKNLRHWTMLTVREDKLYRKDGTPFQDGSYTFIQNNNGSCVAIDGSATHTLYSMDCEAQARVLCQVSRAESVTTTPATLLPQPSTTSLVSPTRQERETLLCPKGNNWKVSPMTGDCFWETSFETRRLTWDEARAYCQAFGGDLASFHSQDEEKIGLSFQYGTFAHPYWIGLRLDLETETYKWSDGTDLDYKNWAPDHPDDKDKRLQCVAMDASSSHWISTFCGIMSWFVCRAPKRSDPAEPVIPTREPLTPCDPTVSNPTQYYFQGYCYEVVNVQHGWHRAEEYCDNEGSSLVSIHSDAEVAFLLRLLYETQRVTGNRVWIGLESLSGTFRWTDWSPVDYTHWNEDEPNNYLNQEKCGNMYVRNGLWNDENCNEKMGFVCKQVKDATNQPEIPSTPDPLEGNCRKGWYPYHDRCYLPNPGRVNWTVASEACQSYGAYLVSIRNEKEQAFLSYLMQGLKADTWIGLHDTIQSGRYFWLDNSNMRYSNWAVGEPSFFSIQEDCVKMLYGDLDSGVWKDELCSEKLPFICQEPKDRDRPKPEFNRGLDCIYPEGWLKLDDMCFKMFEGNFLNWEEAEMSCQRQGAHLISLTDPHVQAVAVYLGTEVNQTFWMGLQYEVNSQNFKWVNGWPLTISKWGLYAPPAVPNENTCFASSPSGFWKSAPCDTELPYICQITTGKGAVLRKFVGECPKISGQWIPTSGSYCHMYDKTRADWFAATLRCFRHGSFMISLHSLSDLQMVKESMKASGRNFPSFFIGLIRNRKGGYSWADQSPVDFVNFEEGWGEDKDDNCVEMMADTLKWRTVACGSKKNFICATTKEEEVNDDSPENEKFTHGSSGGISVAALTAILTCTCLVILIVLAMVFFRPSFCRPWPIKIPYKQEQMSVGFDNALYDVHSACMEFQDDRKDSGDT